jgi:nitroreductase
MLSAGAAAYSILLASNAMGFGSIWLTGDNAYDRGVAEPLGLDLNEKIVGFIYLGTESSAAPRLPKPDLDKKITNWTQVASLKSTI